eukprot:5988186-Prymnesium_polylepis.3
MLDVEWRLTCDAVASGRAGIPNAARCLASRTRMSSVSRLEHRPGSSGKKDGDRAGRHHLQQAVARRLSAGRDEGERRVHELRVRRGASRRLVAFQGRHGQLQRLQHPGAVVVLARELDRRVAAVGHPEKVAANQVRADVSSESREESRPAVGRTLSRIRLALALAARVARLLGEARKRQRVERIDDVDRWVEALGPPVGLDAGDGRQAGHRRLVQPALVARVPEEVACTAMPETALERLELPWAVPPIPPAAQPWEDEVRRVARVTRVDGAQTG